MCYTPRHVSGNGFIQNNNFIAKDVWGKGVLGFGELLDAMGVGQISRGTKFMNTHFIHWYIFATLLALCTIYGVAFITPEVPWGDVVQEDGTTVYQSMSHGYLHPDFPKMDKAGPGAVRHEKTIWVGWALGLGFIMFWTGLLAFGTSRDGNIGPAKIPLIVGCILFMGIITALIFFYRAFMNGDHSTFLSLPRPLALMIYGIWPFPLYFVIVYYKIFDSWHFTDEDQRRFDEILANRRHATSEDH